MFLLVVENLRAFGFSADVVFLLVGSTCNKYNFFLNILFNPKNLQCMVWYRISTGSVPYSVFYCLGWTVFFVLIFSPDISPSVCSCSATSSSGLVRIGAYRPSRSEVSYSFGVGIPISSGISSSSSESSSSSVALAVCFRLWTIFSFPFSISRSILSHLPYLPSRPRRQCLFFGFISPLVFSVVSLRVFFSV